MGNCESRKPIKGEPPSINETKDNLEKPEPGEITNLNFEVLAEFKKDFKIVAATYGCTQVERSRRNMGKTNPLNNEDLREFVELQARFTETEKSWLVDITDIDRESFDLLVKNPSKADEAPLPEPQEFWMRSRHSMQRVLIFWR
ncbi:MAG: hypothetical protein ACYTXA_01475 [Nostoc sp.]